MTTTTITKVKRPSRYGLVKHARTVAEFAPKAVVSYVEYSEYYPDPKHELHYRHMWVSSYKVVINEEIIPEGWKYLASGVSRDAYLGPDGVVYKFPKRDWGSEACQNEYRIWQEKRAKAKAQGVHLARCFWHEAHKVLAMEYCPKARDYDHNSDYAKISGLGLYDIHNQNVWIDSRGRLVMVDYAS